MYCTRPIAQQIDGKHFALCIQLAKPCSRYSSSVMPSLSLSALSLSSLSLPCLSPLFFNSSLFSHSVTPSYLSMIRLSAPSFSSLISLPLSFLHSSINLLFFSLGSHSMIPIPLLLFYDPSFPPSILSFLSSLSLSPSSPCPLILSSLALLFPLFLLSFSSPTNT